MRNASSLATARIAPIALFACIALTATGVALTSACGSSDSSTEQLPGSQGGTGDAGGVGGSGGSDASTGGSSAVGGASGSGGGTSRHDGGEDAGAGGSKPDAALDASSDVAEQEPSAPLKTGYVVLSTFWNSTDVMHATWVRGAFSTGAPMTPPSCTTEAVGGCTISDCPDDLPRLSDSIKAGTLSFSGGTFVLGDVDPDANDSYAEDSPYQYWFMNPPQITISGTGAAFLAFQSTSQAPSFVNLGSPNLHASSGGASILFYKGFDAPLTWLAGTAGDTFVLEVFSGPTWNFRDVPLPALARLQCPAELGAATFPAAWTIKLAGQSTMSYFAFTERRATIDVDSSASVTAVLRQGVIHSPIGGVGVSNCAPDCTGKECGDNGCGATCGTCGSGLTCDVGQCVPSCTPDCLGKQCGSDGCTGTCGTCGTGQTCSSGTCVGCNPVNDTGCSGVQGCWVLSSEQTTCGEPGPGTQGSTCATTSDCAGGHGCFSTTCRKICTLSNADGCTSSETCRGVSGWTTFGACQ